MNRRHAQHGFSLIELAIVLVILGLLVGGGIAALTAATEQTRRSKGERQLELVREALYGFAMARGRLPCADTDDPPDGIENITGTDCTADGGSLPWVDLGLGRRDPWGAPLHYRVDDNPTDFADPTATANNPAFLLSETGTYAVNDGGGNAIVSDTPAVVVSFGPQGSQVWTAGGYTCPAVGTNDFSADENENCDNDQLFVAADLRPPDAGTGRFDDLVIWIPMPVLHSRMVDAGLLP